MSRSQSEKMRIGVGTPNIRAVETAEDRRLLVTWKGGAGSVVDVTHHLAEYAIFAPLRSDDAFRKAQVGDWGWCVHWSDDLEISSDTLWRLALEQGCGVAARLADGASDVTG
jgi:uncharacterized protein DUF2442